MTSRQLAWAQKMAASGRCRQCGKPAGGFALCKKCRDKRKKRRKKAIDAGLCAECGKPRGKGGTDTRCKKCNLVSKGQ